jgi:hypothetical protein
VKGWNTTGAGLAAAPASQQDEAAYELLFECVCTPSSLNSALNYYARESRCCTAHACCTVGIIFGGNIDIVSLSEVLGKASTTRSAYRCLWRGTLALQG